MDAVEAGEYARAVIQAKAEAKAIVINFGQPFVSEARDHVVITIPTDYTFRHPETKTTAKLITYSHLSGLQEQPGVGVIDYRNAETFGQVITAIPQKHCTKDKLRVLQDLPDGTITQRTLVWAFMIHPQQPGSVRASPDKQLFKFCERHSQTQADTNRQFHSSGWIEIGKSEIVAESWPWNKEICDAAVDCVWSWSQSPGHWRAASSSRWSAYGFDIKQSHEKWYATGVFK
jgi:hypothetical protein